MLSQKVKHCSAYRNMAHAQVIIMVFWLLAACIIHIALLLKNTYALQME